MSLKLTDRDFILASVAYRNTMDTMDSVTSVTININVSQ